MACRGYLCAVTLLGTLATVCLIFSVVMPGWIVLDRSVDESDMQAAMNIFMPQELRQAMGLIDGDDILDDLEEMEEPFGETNGDDDGQDGRPSDWMPGHMDWEVRYPDGESVPVESDDTDHHHPHHHPHHHHHHGSSDSDGSSESDDSLGSDPTDMDELIGGRADDHCYRKIADWAANSFGMSELINGFSSRTVHIQAHYGFWFSRYCVKVHDGADGLVMDMPRRKKHGTCSCVIVETGCALKYAKVFDGVPAWMDMPRHSERLGHKHMGGASLLEHRIESTIGVVLCLIGVVAGVIGFRKTNGCCCMKSVCVVAMLITNILFLVPSIRLARYSQYKYAEHNFVDVKFPVSVLVAFTGCLLAFITLVVAIVGLIKMHRKKSVGKWYQLNNELAPDVTDEVKKPGLVFLTDPLPEKPGLYDVCDFEGVTLTAEENEQPAKEAVA